MGQFASTISLSIEEILTLTASVVTDPETAVTELALIAKSLQPRTLLSQPPLSPPPGFDSALDIAILNALNAAYHEAVFIFNAMYPDIELPANNTDYGAVLNYAPVNGNFESLTNQLAACFSDWGLQPALAVAIAAQIQPQAMQSGNTPSVTYGRVATGNITITDPNVTVEYLFWVASFGIFQTGKGTNLNPAFAVIFSFSAANGTLTGTIQ